MVIGVCDDKLSGEAVGVGDGADALREVVGSLQRVAGAFRVPGDAVTGHQYKNSPVRPIEIKKADNVVIRIGN